MAAVAPLVGRNGGRWWVAEEIASLVTIYSSLLAKLARTPGMKRPTQSQLCTALAEGLRAGTPSYERSAQQVLTKLRNLAKDLADDTIDAKLKEIIDRAGITETITNTYFKAASGSLQPASQAAIPISDEGKHDGDGLSTAETAQRPTDEQENVLNDFFASLVPNAGPVRRQSIDSSIHSSSSMDETLSESTLDVDDMLGPAQPRAKRGRKDMVSSMEEVEKEKQETKRRALDIDREVKLAQLELEKQRQANKAELEKQRLEMEARKLELKEKELAARSDEIRAAQKERETFQQAMLLQMERMMQIMATQSKGSHSQ